MTNSPSRNPHHQYLVLRFGLGQYLIITLRVAGTDSKYACWLKIHTISFYLSLLYFLVVSVGNMLILSIMMVKSCRCFSINGSMAYLLLK